MRKRNSLILPHGKISVSTKTYQSPFSELISKIHWSIKAIKNFFRELLQIGNDKVKEATTNEIKDYYDNEDFDKDDVYDVAIDTDKEDELFVYADIDKYYSKDDLEL